MNLRLQIWVTGTDLDVSGALAPLKTDESGCSAQVIYETKKTSLYLKHV
jgi:hypothetical protein